MTTLRAQGDESYVWFEDPSGFTVVVDGGNFVYATVDENGALAPTTCRVGRDNPDAASLPKHVRPSDSFIKDQCRIPPKTARVKISH